MTSYSLRLLLPLVLWFAALTGCGQPLECNPTTCGGCCVGGECEPGTAAFQCGAHGSVCHSCFGGQTCSSGLCVGTPGLGGGAGGGLAISNGGGAGGGGGGGGAASAPSCTVAEDCPNWACDCRSGPPVNSRRCVNNRCQDAAQSCGSACAGFNTCWVGTSTGGFVGGHNSGSSTCSAGGGAGGGSGGGGGSAVCGFSDLGKGCATGSTCQSGLCFGSSPSYICTRGCVSANDCPRNWTCDTTTSGGKVCMTGKTSGTQSTSSVCSSFPFTDVGAPCSSCASQYCIGNACTHRCDVDSDCPSPWKCSTGSDSFKSCRP
jgi:hypothetical protein